MKKKNIAALVALGLVSGFAGQSMAAEPYCREYTRTIKVGGEKQVGYGTACMQRDGTWRIVSEAEPVKVKKAKKKKKVKYVVKEKVVYEPVVVRPHYPWKTWHRDRRWRSEHEHRHHRVSMPPSYHFEFSW